MDLIAREILREAEDVLLASDQRRQLDWQIVRMGVQTDQDGKVVLEPGGYKLKDVLGLEKVPQAMHAEVTQRDRARQESVGGQPSRHLGEQRLAAVGERAQARTAIHGRTVSSRTRARPHRRCGVRCAPAAVH